MTLFLFLLACAGSDPSPRPADATIAAAPATPVSLEELAMTKLDGEPFPGAALAGKVVLFVNVASECGYTPQYGGLQELYAKYADRGLVIVGVPCNQFGGQEPGTPAEIATFCKVNYGVEFPILEKAEVNGPGRAPLYQYLVDSAAGGGKDISWNFEKFLVGRDGKVLARFGSRTKPDDAELTTSIEQALAAGQG